jgi:glycosyltransferase involved in cell wall biosynthesis
MNPLAVIVPAYNASATLPQCLRGLIQACGAPQPILVVDDGSTDDTPRIAAELGVRVVETGGRKGPAAARNLGASETDAPFVLFVDADVVIHPDAVTRARAALEDGAAAVFGSYDDCPTGPGLVSRYRNLLHHWTHQQARGEPSTFWAGLGAVRREAFEGVGGFDPKRYPQPCIEDIELGYRLRDAGHRIVLDKSMLGTHLKRWTLASVIRTDVFSRAIPWTRLLTQRKGLSLDLNLDPAQRLAGMLTLLAVAALPLALFRLEALWLLLALLPVLWINRRLYAFFAQRGGAVFAAGCIPLHLLYYLYSSVSYLYARLVPKP